MGRTRRSGFTLVELLIVTVILGLLAALAVAGPYNRLRERANVVSMRNDLRALSIDQELHLARHDTYTADLSTLELATTDGVTITVNEASNLGWAATATHDADPDNQCGIYVGYSDAANAHPATQEGIIACLSD